MHCILTLRMLHSNLWITWKIKIFGHWSNQDITKPDVAGYAFRKRWPIPNQYDWAYNPKIQKLSMKSHIACLFHWR